MSANLHVEQAISNLLKEFPFAERGSTASIGHNYYQGVAKAADFKSGLHKCTCGRELKGWKAPEYIATVNGKTWSVGYDATSNIISCGPKGYHSDRYSSTQGCDLSDV